jgi:hypothetical protein
MKPHKWAKEIKAWADGAEIEVKSNYYKMFWTKCLLPEWANEHYDFRIKPQPKEPQYLYVCFNDSDEFVFSTERDDFGIDNDLVTYIGKIKLEDESE